MNTNVINDVNTIKDGVSKCVRKAFGSGFGYEAIMLDEISMLNVYIKHVGWNKLEVKAEVLVRYNDMIETLVEWKQDVFAQPSKRAIENGREEQSMINYLVKDKWLAELIAGNLNKINEARVNSLVRMHQMLSNNGVYAGK